jgi:DNA-binding NarL/FixJ family response regulator
VLIVDDHEEFRAAARRLLEADGFHVVGEAADGAQAVTAARELHPDLVLLDVVLPDGNGFDVAELLNPVGVVMVSSRPESAYRLRLARSSARGFIDKAELTGQRIRALVAG